MNASNKAGRAWVAATAVLLAMAVASPSWGAENTKSEVGCHGALSKSIGKHAAAVSKAMAVCRNTVLASGMGTCPDATATAAIVKSQEKAAKTVVKKCQSTCSISQVPCLGSTVCPPNGVLQENCSGDLGSNFFEFGNMGFPGPYCEAAIDDRMLDPADFGTCANSLGELISDEVLDALYGSLAAPPATEAGADCLAGLVKSAPKNVSKLAGSVAKCRNAQLGSDAPTVLPNECATGDQKTADALAKTRQKFEDAVTKSCTPAGILELSVCGNPVGGTDLATAQDCLGDMVEEAAYSVDPETRPYAPISVVNAAYPDTAKARCGDDLVNQKANQFLLNGEECDGDDDSECDGACFPAGDVFQCTCSTIARSRGFASGFEADLDNGWSGKSHNAVVTDRAGFVSDLSNCNCDEFDPVDTATCIGATTDPVCNVFSEVKPRCEHRIGDGTTCDQVGNLNNAHADSDCRACDVDSANVEAFCDGEATYCVNGTNDGDPCNYSSECGGGTCTGTGRCETGPFVGQGCVTNVQASACGVCVGGTNDGGSCFSVAGCPGLGTSCTPHGCEENSCINGTNEGNVCSNNADCPGLNGRCAQVSDCTSQCYPDAGGPPTGICARQADCDAGERCRGLCESNACLKIRNGAPLPLSANGTSVCIDSQFFTNITGTRNVVDGSHAVNYDLRSVTFLAGANEINPRPCPVCGGFCESTPEASEGQALQNSILCDGTCTAGPQECRVGPLKGTTCANNAECDGNLCTGARCRFDDDCASGTCSAEDSSECATLVTDGGTGDCRLDLACGGGTTPGQACRIEANTAFGTTSPDCAQSGSNISGAGLAISWTPLTSGAIELEQPGACDASGYQNFDCNCVTGGGGTRNQPNDCAPACNTGANFGVKCSAFTSCVGGSEPGVACDEDSDCSGIGATCSGNPGICGTDSTGECSIRRCDGGSSDGASCTQDSGCPGGTCPLAAVCIIGGAPCSEGTCKPDACVTAATCDNGATCDDACPGGRCTPLCVPRGICNGGDKDDAYCALNADCIGGGTCVPEDAEEGACASGAFEHCDGPGWEFISCGVNNANTQTACEAGVNGILGDSDDNIGAGYCRSDINNCFINDGAAAGGGTATNPISVAAYCIPASTSPAVNSTAGLPGPGRIRQPSLVVPNFTELSVP